MLEKPDIQDEALVACMQDQYGLQHVQVSFLPLGADRNTAVYRALAADETPYFLKLRRGIFNETLLALTKFLSDQGIPQVIPPLMTDSGQLWTRLNEFNLILYPFVDGKDGYEVELSDQGWIEFGIALKAIHSAKIPPAILSNIKRETCTSYWRNKVRTFQARAENEIYNEPTAVKLAAFLKLKRDVVHIMVERAEQLAAILRARSADSTLCHADLHPGNFLITPDGRLYLVDWDDPLLAYKERDLMFVGGGFNRQGNIEQEETLFYQGYGQTEIAPIALAYYRHERIIQDIAAYCEQLLLTDEGGQDRENGLRQLMSSFVPNGVVDIAFKTYKRLPPEFQT